ncbi:hypothetical protein B0H17DRAFT_1108585 [Mycena rosella]|uniref:Uncharacterized protein n=1 Tax=Mycena rosella TaxID=1033263 RepID=A0AAD7FPW9_MYCRO|nr:hypothetical protein B0H17DRAFT_1108585 [Mycena rosella]
MRRYENDAHAAPCRAPDGPRLTRKRTPRRACTTTHYPPRAPRTPSPAQDRAPSETLPRPVCAPRPTSAAFYDSGRTRLARRMARGVTPRWPPRPCYHARPIPRLGRTRLAGRPMRVPRSIRMPYAAGYHAPLDAAAEDAALDTPRPTPRPRTLRGTRTRTPPPQPTHAPPSARVPLPSYTTPLANSPTTHPVPRKYRHAKPPTKNA